MKNVTVDPDGAVVVCLAYALACKYLESTTGKNVVYWSTKFSRVAMEKLLDDDFTPEQLEELCAEALNGGEKLP